MPYTHTHTAVKPQVVYDSTNSLSLRLSLSLWTDVKRLFEVDSPHRKNASAGNGMKRGVFVRTISSRRELSQ